MIMRRMLAAAALVVALAPGLGAQQATDPMAAMRSQMDSMQAMIHEMHQMMMSMHGQGGGMMMGGMQGAQGQGGMAMGGMQGAQGQGGMMMGGMQGMGGMQNPDAGLGALLGGPPNLVQLTDTQRTELQAILARARAEALQKLTPEQRARLESMAPMSGAGATPNPNH